MTTLDDIRFDLDLAIITFARAEHMMPPCLLITRRQWDAWRFDPGPVQWVFVSNRVEVPSYRGIPLLVI